MAVDLVLNLTWLPVRAHMTYGLRSAKEVFTSQSEFPICFVLSNFINR